MRKRFLRHFHPYFSFLYLLFFTLPCLVVSQYLFCFIHPPFLPTPSNSFPREEGSRTWKNFSSGRERERGERSDSIIVTCVLGIIKFSHHSVNLITIHWNGSGAGGKTGKEWRVKERQNEFINKWVKRRGRIESNVKKKARRSGVKFFLVNFLVKPFPAFLFFLFFLLSISFYFLLYSVFANKRGVRDCNLMKETLFHFPLWSSFPNWEGEEGSVKKN